MVYTACKRISIRAAGPAAYVSPGMILGVEAGGRVATKATLRAGCAINSSAPIQGDVRLVSLGGTVTATSTCDEVHFGGVEIFNDGVWGRICAGRVDQFTAFTVDAKVVCRQLGFPLGSLYDTFGGDDVGVFADADYGDPYSDAGSGRPSEIVWATEVVCTGKEERLGECFFPEEFGDNPGGFPSGYYDDVDEETQGGPGTQPGLLRTPCSFRDRSVFGVICRQFEIPGVNSLALVGSGAAMCNI